MNNEPIPDVVSGSHREVAGTALFRIVTQRIAEISYRLFGTSYRFQESKRKHLDSWSLKMGPICRPETSVRNDHQSLRNDPEESSSRSVAQFVYKLPFSPLPLTKLSVCTENKSTPVVTERAFFSLRASVFRSHRFLSILWNSQSLNPDHLSLNLTHCEGTTQRVSCYRAGLPRPLHLIILIISVDTANHESHHPSCLSCLLSPPVASCHLLWPPVTSCYLLSHPVASCHLLLPPVAPVTPCPNTSLSSLFWNTLYPFLSSGRPCSTPIQNKT